MKKSTFILIPVILLVATSVCSAKEEAFMYQATPDSPAVKDASQSSIAIFMQAGPQPEINAVELSSDGRFLLATGNGNAKIWDVESGREFRTFYGFNAQFASDSSDVIVDGKLMSISSGEVIKKMGLGGVETARFISKDLRYYLNPAIDHATLYDYATGKEIWRFGHMGAVVAAAFSPDSRYAVTGGDGSDKTIKMWDLSTGRLIRTFVGHSAGINAVVFSPDLRYLVSTGTQTRTTRAYVMCDTKDPDIIIWDVSTGKELRRLRVQNDCVFSLAFSQDGRHIVSGSWNGVVKLWDVKSGNEVKTFRTPSGGVTAVALSKDGQYIVAGCRDDFGIVMWKISTGKVVRVIQRNLDYIADIAFTPDGNRLLSTSRLSPPRLWDLTSGTLQMTFTDLPKDLRGAPMKDMVIMDDGDKVLSRAGSTVYMWQISTGKVLKKVSDVLGSSVSFSQDGRYALAGGENRIDMRTFQRIGGNRIDLWNLDRGRVVQSYTSKAPGGLFSRTIFSPDNKHFLTVNNDKTCTLFEIATGKEVAKYDMHRGGPSPHLPVFSPDGRYLFFGLDILRNLDLREVATGKQAGFLFRSFQDVLIAPHEKRVMDDSRQDTIIYTTSVFFDLTPHCTFSADSRRILVEWGNKLALLDIPSRKLIKVIPLESGAGNFRLTKDGRHIVAASLSSRTGVGEGSQIYLYDAASGAQIAKFFMFADGEWVVMLPDGYYNASQNAHKHINVRKERQVYGIDQFYDVFYRPDIVAARLKGEDISGLETVTLDNALACPPPVTEFTSRLTETDQPKIKVCYRVNSTGCGIGEVRLFHNGKLVQSDGYYKEIVRSTADKTQLAALNSKTIYEDMRSINVKSKIDSAPTSSKAKGDVLEDCGEMEPVPGENEVSVSAFNRSNTVQSFMKTISFNSKVKREDPHLYILAVGIDSYKDSTVNLKYAVKDAAELEEKLKAQSATIFKPRNIHYALLTDGMAIKKYISNKIDELSKTMKPQDSFILFVAGHGLLLQNQYYMLTHDYDGQINENNMISSNEIVEMSKKIKSLNQLFIFDTCHAGGVDYIISGLYDARMSVLAKKMGLHIYASASDKQAAMDGYGGNGLFTHVLLDGLNDNRVADTNHDGYVSIVELGEYSKQKTSAISKEIGHSQTPHIINFGKDNPIYRLN
jgi:WD40 repeat protein